MEYIEFEPITSQPNLEITSKPFIEANTIAATLDEIKNEHIIPVYSRTNEILISHDEFINNTLDVASSIFRGQSISNPSIRLSHPIKGRIPEAKDKPANQLMPWEKTLLYERMAFAIEIPSINTTIDGNKLSLTIGGVKAFNQDNLYGKASSDQHFKIFIGFKVLICSNLTVWTDGFQDNLKVRNTNMLRSAISSLIQNFNDQKQINSLKQLANYSITEKQFAELIGKCRMYNHLPTSIKKDIPPILFGDQQMGTVVKDYYRDDSFSKDEHGNINLWRLYNLFTGANKQSYIDSFLERSVNAFNITDELKSALDGRSSWYLN
jgi:hypothetical protein